jgi:hypothetical protein
VIVGTVRNDVMIWFELAILLAVNVGTVRDDAMV